MNGNALDEPYAVHLPKQSRSAGAKIFRPPEIPAVRPARPEWAAELPQTFVNGELVVPPGDYFMMGDNRDNSNDSRFWGFVPRENIIGTPVIIYMSIDAPEDVWEPGHVGERFETYLNAMIHPSEFAGSACFTLFKIR